MPRRSLYLRASLFQYTFNQFSVVMLVAAVSNSIVVFLMSNEFSAGPLKLVEVSLWRASKVSAI